MSADEDPAFKVVNKQVSLGKYEPHDLVDYKDKRLVCKEGIRVVKRIIPDLEKLIAAAKKDGLTLKVASGYRSYRYQGGLFNEYIKKEMAKNPKLTRKQAEEIANFYSAKSGHSEHQLGTTVDVLSSENGFSFSSDPKLKYIKWLEGNASKFNFKISHGKDSTQFMYEPWHLRWYPPRS